MKKSIVVALSLLLAPIGGAQTPNAVPTLTPSGRGVVFPAKLARKFSNQCSRRSPTGWWTSVAPSKVEIKKLEAALPQWMKTIPRPRWKGDFSVYYYQYGAVIRDGKRLIYVNVLPVSTYDEKNRWQRQPTIVCDGGPNFWGIEWDSKTGKFQNASFNGRV